MQQEIGAERQRADAAQQRANDLGQKLAREQSNAENFRRRLFNREKENRELREANARLTSEAQATGRELEQARRTEQEQQLQLAQRQLQMDREAAEARQREILQDAAETRERIVQEAKRKADAEGQRIVAAAREQAATEREAILQDARRQVALLSVAISEKLLRGKLTDKAAQTQLAERLFDEFEQHQNRDKS